MRHKIVKYYEKSGVTFEVKTFTTARGQFRCRVYAFKNGKLMQHMPLPHIRHAVQLGILKDPAVDQFLNDKTQELQAYIKKSKEVVNHRETKNNTDHPSIHTRGLKGPALYQYLESMYPKGRRVVW